MMICVLNKLDLVCEDTKEFYGRYLTAMGKDVEEIIATHHISRSKITAEPFIKRNENDILCLGYSIYVPGNYGEAIQYSY